MMPGDRSCGGDTIRSSRRSCGVLRRRRRRRRSGRRRPRGGDGRPGLPLAVRPHVALAGVLQGPLEVVDGERECGDGRARHDAHGGGGGRQKVQKRA